VEAGGRAAGQLQKLPADDNWKDVKAAVPGTTLAASQAPTVFVSTRPGAILVTGAPVYLHRDRHEAAVGEQHGERRVSPR
jgi:hypothetical protein